MATATFYPAAFDSDYTAASVSGTSNPVGKGSSNTTYATINLTTGSSAETLVFWSFDLSSIPDGSTINSVTCKAKAYISSTSSNYISSRTIRLYAGSTAKGSATTVSNSTSALTLTPGTWTLEELKKAYIALYAKRGTRNTTTTYYFRFYGAELVVDYSAPQKTLTVQNDTDVVVSPSTTADYDVDSTVQVQLATIEGIKVTLDDTDITAQFTETTLATSYSGAPSASSYTGLQSGAAYVAYAVGHTAEDPDSSTSNYYGSSSATSVDTCYAQYTFDLSSIPSTATNITVDCVVCGHAESTTYNHTTGSNGNYSVWALCSNGTEKTDQVHSASTSNKTFTIPASSWTYSELQGLQLRHYVGYYGGGTVGATLTISYTLEGGSTVYVYSFTMDTSHTLALVTSAGAEPVLYVKQNGEWKAVGKVYRKVYGAWAEVTDLASLFADASDNTNSGYYIDK